jgi:molybdate transport system substrate-binding protein
MRPSGIVAVALGGLLVAACSGGAPAPARPGTTETPNAAPTASSVETVELSVFAAASLKGALADAKVAYEASHPGVTIVVSTDSSATLATQIDQGAPADLFLSADTRNPQRLADGGLAEGAPVPFAANELAIIVPAGNPAGLTSAADLARPGVKVIAAGDDVPITKYATELVANLAAEPGFPEGFEAGYAANVVSREDNVGAVVAKVELGEGDAAIVYVTDAAASDGLLVLEMPEGANVPAAYAGVVVKGAAHAEAAAAFLDWLAGADGRTILSRFGFLPVP